MKHIAVQQEKNYNFAIIIIIMDPFNNIIKGPFNITPTLLKDLKLTKESFHVIDFQDRLDNVEEKNISKHLRKCKKYKKKEKNMSKHLRKCKKKIEIWGRETFPNFLEIVKNRNLKEKNISKHLRKLKNSDNWAAAILGSQKFMYSHFATSFCAFSPTEDLTFFPLHIIFLPCAQFLSATWYHCSEHPLGQSDTQCSQW